MSFYIVEKDGIGISVRGIAKSRSAASKVANSNTTIVDEDGLRQLKSKFIVTSGAKLAKVMVGDGLRDEDLIASEILKIAKDLIS